MTVQTYLIEKPQSLVSDIEVTTMWFKKIEELDLKGQKLLHQQDNTLIPFYKLKVGEIRMFNILYPEKSDVEVYEDNIIPLEVLSIISFANKKAYFRRIAVWYNIGDSNCILVGYDKNSYYTYNIDYDNIYLLARWGEELKSFSELLSITKEKFIREKLAEFQAEISNLEINAYKYFNEYKAKGG